MNRKLFVTYGIAAGVLALAGLLYAIRSVGVVAVQTSSDIGASSLWPTVLLSAVVLVTGIAAQHRLVTRPGKRSSFQIGSDTRSLIAIAVICCLGLLVSLCAAIYGLDLIAGLQ